MTRSPRRETVESVVGREAPRVLVGLVVAELAGLALGALTPLRPAVTVTVAVTLVYSRFGYRAGRSGGVPVAMATTASGYLLTMPLRLMEPHSMARPAILLLGLWFAVAVGGLAGWASSALGRPAS